MARLKKSQGEHRTLAYRPQRPLTLPWAVLLHLSTTIIPVATFSPCNTVRGGYAGIGYGVLGFR